MKASLVPVGLVAVASSLATVGALELLRGSRPGPEALAVEPAAAAPAAVVAREAELLVPAPHSACVPTDHEDRLVELERRIGALELDSTSLRAPITPARAELPPEDELRDLVLDWVAEEREAHARARELEAEEEQGDELEFEARFGAHMLAQEHGLDPWQEDKLAEALLEVEIRRKETDESVDLLTDDPEQVEARYDEFDSWAAQHLEEVLGQELYRQIFGED